MGHLRSNRLRSSLLYLGLQRSLTLPLLLLLQGLVHYRSTDRYTHIVCDLSSIQVIVFFLPAIVDIMALRSLRGLPLLCKRWVGLGELNGIVFECLKCIGREVV